MTNSDKAFNIRDLMVKAEKILTWPGTDHQITLTIATQKDMDVALVEAEKTFKNIDI